VEEGEGIGGTLGVRAEGGGGERWRVFTVERERRRGRRKRTSPLFLGDVGGRGELAISVGVRVNFILFGLPRCALSAAGGQDWTGIDVSVNEMKETECRRAELEEENIEARQEKLGVGGLAGEGEPGRTRAAQADTADIERRRGLVRIGVGGRGAVDRVHSEGGWARKSRDGLGMV
jgi:hypothetical protein